MQKVCVFCTVLFWPLRVCPKHHWVFFFSPRPEARLAAIYWLKGLPVDSWFRFAPGLLTDISLVWGNAFLLKYDKMCKSHSVQTKQTFTWRVLDLPKTTPSFPNNEPIPQYDCILWDLFFFFFPLLGKYHMVVKVSLSSQQQLVVAALVRLQRLNISELQSKQLDFRSRFHVWASIKYNV